MATKTRSKAEGLRYASYKAQNKHATNRKRKLLRLQKEQPNNEQLVTALATIKYRRYTPKVQHWSHTAIYFAKLMKDFKKQVNINVPKMTEKQMFSMKTRVTVKGVPFWNHS